MKSSKYSRLGARLGIYIVGLMLISFAIALSVKCDLGVSPVSSLPYVISQIVGISLGTCSILVYTVYILVQMILGGRKFQPALLLQLLMRRKKASLIMVLTS